MVKLISQLAWSNLRKNRQLYYPFALATILSVAILYIFISLTFNPGLDEIRGGASVRTVLFLGVVIVSIAVAAIVTYANGFVMKNRAKEMGLYEILGLNKGHLIHMMGLELLIFASLSASIGIVLGIAFDQLIYALLLKLMSWPVTLASTFQWLSVFAVLFISAAVFGLAWLNNLTKLVRLKALELNQESRKGEKKSLLLLPQTLLGLVLMGLGYFMAIAVQNPLAAIFQFFGATLLVIAGTYLLFNAGTTVLLQTLKKHASYYKPTNFIAISNLVFRMKKNAMGLATIAILSTMVLISLIGGSSIYMGSTDFVQKRNPYDFSFQVQKADGENLTAADVSAKMTQFAEEHQIPVTEQVAFDYVSTGIEQIRDNQITLLSNYSGQVPASYLTILDSETYAAMTGKTVELADNQALLYENEPLIDDQQPLELSGLSLTVTSRLPENITAGKLPDVISSIIPDQALLVVRDLDQTLAAMANLETDSDQETLPQRRLYVGMDTSLSENQQIALNDAFLAFTKQHMDALESFVDPLIKSVDAQEIYSMMGSVFFIGILLSIIFMLGTVLVIYYKQISEGYEDRENFIILQKVGLDEHQTKAAIRKQVLTVFFLPLLFAFSHLAASFNMVSKIIRLIVPASVSMLLLVTLAVCLAFILSYLTVFALTSRSYRKVVSR